MKLTLIAFLSFLVITSYGQELHLSKHSVTKLFVKSIPEKLNDANGWSSHHWTFCGTDSSISMSDTIKMFNNSYPIGGHCCQSISWMFYKKHFFRTQETSWCMEPPLSTAIDLDQNYNIKLKTTDKNLHLKVFKSGRKVYDFIIVKIEYIKEAYTKSALITMVNSH